MTSSRLGRLGVPLGVGAAVLALTLTALVQQSRDDGPARLPIALQSGRDATAAGGEGAAAPAVGDRAMHGGNLTYRFAAGTLDGLADEGRAYRLSTGRADRDAVQRLAAALGLGGEPSRSDDSWVVRDGARELRVWDKAGNPWSFSPYAETRCDSGAGGASGSGGGTEPAPPPDSPPAPDSPAPPDGAEPDVAPAPVPKGDTRCVKPAPPAEHPTTGAEPAEPAGASPKPAEKPAVVCAAPPAPGTSSDPQDTPCHDTPTPVEGSSSGGGSTGVACGCPEGAKCACAEPTPLALGPESEARAKATAVLEASGHDDAVLRVERGYDAWYISADLRVGGLRTIGFGSHVGIDADGDVRDAGGWLGSAEGADTYPLLDPEAAVKRSPWGAGVRPMMACDAMIPECEQPQDVVRDVTAVELGLLFAPVLSGDEHNAYLVPAWLLTAKGQPVEYPEAVVALPDEFIQQPEPLDSDHGCDAKDDCDRPVCDTPDGSCPGVPADDSGGTSDGSGSVPGAEPTA